MSVEINNMIYDIRNRIQKSTKNAVPDYILYDDIYDCVDLSNRNSDVVTVVNIDVELREILDDIEVESE